MTSAPEPLPEWINVWRWYRHTHPADRRPFPQQPHYVGDDLLDYDAVHVLWLARDGAPSPAQDEFLAFINEANIAGGGTE